MSARGTIKETYPGNWIVTGTHYRIDRVELPNGWDYDYAVSHELGSTRTHVATYRTFQAASDAAQHASETERREDLAREYRLDQMHLAPDAFAAKWDTTPRLR